MVKENNHTDGDVDPLNHGAYAMEENFQFKFCLQQINNNLIAEVLYFATFHILQLS